MSHFTVLVCLPKDTNPEKIEHAIGEAVARWDEERDVEPYRNYEDGAAEDYWWVDSVRRGTEHHRNGTGLEVDEAARRYRGVTPEIKAAEYADDAAWATKLGDHPTWETVVNLYNAKYHPGTELAKLGEPTSDDRLHYDAESGRAYTWSTSNPEGLWDWWVVGGRWQRQFIAMQGVERSALIFGRPGSFGDNDAPKVAATGGLHCDGGPRYLLDFATMRDNAAAEANGEYDQWEAICADTPVARPWSDFASLADLQEITWDDARREYNAQPRVQRAKEVSGHFNCPVQHFMSDRDEYVAEARRAAVPGYALVTLDGEWCAPGRMGWFGMGSDEPETKSAYRIAANQYLDQLDPGAFVVLIDCHV